MIRPLLFAFFTGCQSCSDELEKEADATLDSGSVAMAPPNILIIDIAGLRSDRLDNPPPGIKTLQNQGVTFSHSIAPSGNSATSFMAMAMGRSDPVSKGGAADPTWTLFNALNEAGYHTSVAWGNTDFQTLAFQNTWLDPSSQYQDLGDIEGVTQTLRLEMKEPFVLLLHDRDLHRTEAAPTATDARSANRIYNQSLMAYDAQLQRLLNTLKDTGLNQRTIVVLTSNHGVDLFDHSHLGHDSMLWDTVVRTPLIIADPDLPPASDGYIQSRPISTLDLAPTLLERVKLESPNSLSGISLTDALHTQPLPERDFYSWTPNSAASIRNTKWKLILQPEGCAARDKQSHPPLEGRQCTLLYDLERDPDERESLTIGLPHVANQLETQLTKWLMNQQGGSATPTKHPEN